MIMRMRNGISGVSFVRGKNNKKVFESSELKVYIDCMKIEREECERKVNEVFEKMNEVKEWFDKNWEEMDDEGKCCWENYCANMVESLNFYL